MIMKACLIKACAPGPFKEYKKDRGGPTQNIFSVAATTPDNVELELVDETAGMKVNYETKADVIGLFMSTPDALQAYRHAAKFKQRGKTVIFGGLHPSFLPDEALQHGDAVIIGESEGVWEQLLVDFSVGQLKQRYQRSEPYDPALLKPYPTHLIDRRQFNGFWSVLVSRGCPRKCAFCLVNPFFKGIRYRPVQNVVEEIRQCEADWIELHADNLTYDRDYAIELFRALKPLKINWVGETTINICEDHELLELAAESGLRYLLVGLETPSASALKGVGKGFIDAKTAKQYVKKLHSYNIVVDSAMLFGFDGHDSSIFEQTLKFVNEIELDVSPPVITIPFPGSRLYQQYEQEGRLLHKDWSKYDGSHAVFRPAQMTPEELEQGVKWYMDQHYSLTAILKRKAKQAKNVGMVRSAYLGLQ